MKVEGKDTSTLAIALLLDILLKTAMFLWVKYTSPSFRAFPEVSIFLFFSFFQPSLQAFVKDASSFSHEAVDRLLDVLTEGAHSKYLKQMAEVRLKGHVKGATSRFAHLEKFSLEFSSSSFVICVNLLHP